MEKVGLLSFPFCLGGLLSFVLRLFFLRSSIGGVACVTVFNSSATTWAATFRLSGVLVMLVVFELP